MGSVSDAVIGSVLEIDARRMPSEARANATIALVDAIGVAFAGAQTELCHSLLDVMRACGSLDGPHQLLGTPYTSNMGDAAVFNGAAIHAMDYDDTLYPGPLHASCVLLPALLGAAYRTTSSGEQFLTSYIVGCEVAGHLARAINPDHHARGWHSTSTIGTIAAALSCARLLNLNADQTRYALGIACSSAAGIRANVGTMTKPLHAGEAARAGVLAAIRAGEGFTAAWSALETKYGYLEIYADADRLDLSPVLTIGDEYELAGLDSLALKPYPCCGEATALVEASLELAAGDLPLAQVRAVRLRIGPTAAGTLTYPRPANADQARFSAEFCAVAPLITKRADLETFSDATLEHPDVRRLVDVVTVVVAPPGGGEQAVELELKLADGSTRRAEVVAPKGRGQRKLSEEERYAKFADCLSGIEQRRIDELFARLRNLDDEPELRFLTTELGGG